MNLQSLNNLRMGDARKALRSNLDRVMEADNGPRDRDPREGFVSLAAVGQKLEFAYAHDLLDSKLLQRTTDPDGTVTVGSYKIPAATLPFTLAQGSEFTRDADGTVSGQSLGYTEYNQGHHTVATFSPADAQQGFLLADSRFRA